MITHTNHEVEIIQSELLQRTNEVLHFFSTRKGGASKGVFSSLNFGTQYGEDANIGTNLNILANTLSIERKRIVIPRQTHGNKIAIVTEENLHREFAETDALITNLPGVCVAVKTADCVPVLVYDPAKKVVAAIHAGWRGATSNIVGKTISIMEKTFGCEASDLLASIGPSVGQNNYEVGEEVSSIFEELFPNAEQVVFIPNQKGEKKRVHVAEANRQWLLKSGIPEHNIEMLRLCTFDRPEWFYSARRDGAKTGRMLNGIMMK